MAIGKNQQLITISSHQVTQNILSLFDFTKPTMPRAFNVLEGVTRGDILVDNLLNPTAAVVHEAVYGTLYFGGRMDPFLLAFLVTEFRQKGEVGIGCWLDDPLNDMLPTDPAYDGRTLYFTERLPVAKKQDSFPDGYELAVRNQVLLQQSFDY